MSRPRSVTYLYQTPIFDWCAISYGSKNGHRKNMIERDQTTWSNKFTILGSVVNLIVGRGGRPMWSFKWK